MVFIDWTSLGRIVDTLWMHISPRFSPHSPTSAKLLDIKPCLVRLPHLPFLLMQTFNELFKYKHFIYILYIYINI